MQTAEYVRDYYILTYTEAETGHKKTLEVDTKDLSLAEAIKQICDAGRLGPIKVCKHWVLVTYTNLCDDEDGLTELLTESPIWTTTIS